MEDFITPPNHQGFLAKQLFANCEEGKILNGFVAYLDPNGGGPEPPHTHSQDHLFIVTEGCITFKVADREIVVKKDNSLYVKGEEIHSLWNRTDKIAKVIKINLINSK